MDQSPAEHERRPDERAPADHGSTAPTGRSWVRWLLWLRTHWVALGLAAIAIYAGTTLVARRLSSDDAALAAAAKKKAEDQKKAGDGPKDPFSFGAFTVRPSETDRIESGIKPGHWTTASLEVRANFDDFRGDLVAEMVGPNGEGVDLDGLPFRLRSSRPALLPRAQKKVLDVAMLSPTQSFSRQVAPRLLSSSGRDVWNARELLTLLPVDQFYFVVLAQTGRLSISARARFDLGADREQRGPWREAHYRVLLPSITVASPVPNNVLFWTSTAAVLWDEFDPDLLTPSQQQAIVDWLHWGGQLIVSGPDSLESLRASFLDGFLPAAAGESWEMAAETLAPWRNSPPMPGAPSGRENLGPASISFSTAATRMSSPPRNKASLSSLRGVSGEDALS